MYKKYLWYWLTLTCLVGFAILLTNCHHSQPGKEGSHIEGSLPHLPTSSPSADTTYTEGKAMSNYRNQPQRAIAIIDSAVILGNITPGRGKYLRAVTQYGGFENLPLARQLCEELTEEKPDSETVQQAYSLLTIIEYSLGHFPAVILYATEASRRAHDLDNPIEVGKMEGYIAQAMSQTGRTDEGIQRLNTTIANIRNINTFSSVTAYHNISKKLLHILLENQRYADMVTVCQDMLQRTNQLAQHPEQFTGIAPGFNPDEFIDFARGQTNAFLTVAYARQYTAAKNTPTEITPTAHLQLLQKARQAQAAVMATQWSKSLDCDRMMTSAYPHLGEFQRFEQAMARLDATRPDTINVNYLISLELRSLAAEMQGDTHQALYHLQRATVIRDSLDNNNQKEQINELATLYHLQEEQIARYQAEADKQLLTYAITAIIIILLLTIAFAVYFFYKRRETIQKNRALVKMIDEMHHTPTTLNLQTSPLNPQPSNLNPQPSPLTPQTSNLNPQTSNLTPHPSPLFQEFTHLIHTQQLYRDLTLDRDAVCQRLNIQRHTLNELLNTYADGLSLPAYINNVRLDVAYQLLRDQPAKSIADIATDVGFTPQNLRLQFKRRYGITPTEYRQSR